MRLYRNMPATFRVAIDPLQKGKDPVNNDIYSGGVDVKFLQIRRQEAGFVSLANDAQDRFPSTKHVAKKTRKEDETQVIPGE